MRQTIFALVTGTIFGMGLALSDMINPARVLAFLDLFGNWDPSLAFVMGGALIPSAIGYWLSRRMRAPVAAERFYVPDNRQIDRRLLVGGALFGAGWGLVGFCPGPAVAGLVFAKWQTLVFVVAMIVGMVVHRILTQPRQPHGEPFIRF